MIKNSLIPLSFLFLLFIHSPFFAQSNSWEGLTPLKSTRADVEKLLGKPTEDSRKSMWDYRTEKGLVSFNYIDYKCDGGWNVPKDTIYSITFLPKSDENKSSEDLKLDQSKFNIISTDTFTGSWTNAIDGIRYRFTNIERELDFITYIPKQSDNNLRCNGFPDYQPQAQYFTMEEYSFEMPILELFPRLDSFLIQLITDKKNEMKGYVMVYFDKNKPFKDQKAKLEKVSHYTYQKRKIPRNKLKIIEGGLRREAVIELYLLPKEKIPPAPVPEFPSPQFMKK